MDRQNEMSTQAYWNERAARMQAEISADAEHAQSLTGRLQAAERKVGSLYADRAAHTDAEIAEAEAAVQAIRAEIEAKSQGEWDRETTIARRAEWNAKARTLKTWAAVRAAEKAQGWTVEALKAAVKRHGL
jgi:DNA repair exonuclease SbcCD ATPase subunit